MTSTSFVLLVLVVGVVVILGFWGLEPSALRAGVERDECSGKINKKGGKESAAGESSGVRGGRRNITDGILVGEREERERRERERERRRKKQKKREKRERERKRKRKKEKEKEKGWEGGEGACTSR